MTKPGDSPSTALPDDTSKVEPKVFWSTLGAYLSGVVVLALVNAFTGTENQLLIEVLPDVVEPFLLPVVPAAVAAISGYFARHQWRTDGSGRRG